MIEEVLSEIRSALKQSVDAHTKQTAQNFFKEQVLFYGVKVATVKKIAVKYYPKNTNLTKEDMFSICEELLKSDYSEEAFIAAEWSYRLRKKYEVRDFHIFEDWLHKYINTWAKCDTLCNHTIGAFIEQYPQYIQNLKQWARSENRWVRRGAAVTLVLPARHGKFLEDVFEIADILMQDEDDLVRKGYGWMLKEASRIHQQEVFDYVERNKAIMPRTALRYAIEKMPKDLRQQAMKKA